MSAMRSWAAAAGGDGGETDRERGQQAVRGSDEEDQEPDGDLVAIADLRVGEKGRDVCA